MNEKLSFLTLLTCLFFLSSENLFGMQNLNQNLGKLRTNLSELKTKLQVLDKKLSGLDQKLAESQPPIKRQDIFKFVTGLPENNGTYNEKFHINFVTKADGFSYIQNIGSKEDFCCGKITMESLKKLQDWDSEQPAQKNMPGTFTFIFYTGTNKNNYSKADIFSLQADPENRDAVFQLASRFHGLEGGCAHKGVLNSSNSYGFDQMLYGPAQGEFASFSAAPGTIYKIYGYEPINLLADTPFSDLIYPETSGGSMPMLSSVVPKAPGFDWTKSLRIYFQEHIQVVAGDLTVSNGSQSKYKRVSNSQFINQIPVAAFDWRYGKVADDMTKIRSITQEMLNGFYEGTLLAAAKNHKSKIYLTAVGGGAFENDHDLIMKAIANERMCAIINK